MHIKWWMALVTMFMMYAVDPGTGGNGNGDGGTGSGGNGNGDGGTGSGGNGNGDGGTGSGDGGTGSGDGGTGGGSGDGGTGGNGNGDGGTGSGDGGNKGGEGGDKSNDPPKLMWPENWREDYAGTDEKLLNQLKRFNSPRDVIDSYIAANKKLSSGEFKTALAKDAKPEEVARWREQNGIPAEPKGYADTLELPQGLQLGEADNAAISDFFLSAHEANMHPKDVNAAVSWYFEHIEREGALEMDRIARHRTDADMELHKDWGDMYKRNLNVVSEVLDRAGGDFKDYMFNATGPDGVPLGNNPQFLRWAAQLGMELNPAATVVPGSGTNSARAIDDEIAAIEADMNKDRNAYFKDEKKQARYRELLAAREKVRG
jgi:hypothetical protein